MTFELKWEKPSEELVDRLYKELGMTRESVKEDVRLLSQWLSKQPHLPKITDEDLMERFLFNCKNSLEVAKTKMDLYYTVRATMPEYFIGRDPTDPNLRQNMLYAVLPKLSDDGCRIILVKLYDKDPANFQPLLANKTALMVLDILLRIEKSAGYQVIYDPEGLTLSHTGAVTIRMTKNFFQCALSAFPQRVKGIHIINSSPVTVAFINFNKMFLKEKIKNRMHIHAKGSETLFDHIPKNILPKEFGGTYPFSMDQIRELTQKQTAEHKNLFIKEEDLVADLSKKAENEQPMIQEAQLFGLQGSFRHMHID